MSIYCARSDIPVTGSGLVLSSGCSGRVASWSNRSPDGPLVLSSAFGRWMADGKVKIDNEYLLLVIRLR
jgi:hypothetical protein